MDRRLFVSSAGAALGFLVVQKCGCAFAATGPKRVGCGLHASSVPTETWLPKLIEPAAQSLFSNHFSTEPKMLNSIFGVRAALALYSETSGPNALATPTPTDVNHPDGTVLFGTQLLGLLMKDGNESSKVEVISVLAHEWGHILQFKKKLATDWVVPGELSADYLAGWYLKQRGIRADWAEHSSEFFSSLGGTDYQDEDFHGTPMQRENMLRNGFTKGAEANSVEQALKWSLYKFDRDAD